MQQFHVKKKLTDEAIIKEIIATQNPKMVQQLYERYSRKVYHKCLSFVKDSFTAEDLMHDIFLKVYLNLASFKGKSRFSTWLYSITYNYCTDYVRAHQREIQKRMAYQKFVVRDVPEDEDAQDRYGMALHKLATSLTELKTQDKNILVLKYQEGKRIKEITKLLDISESAAKMRIKRAKERTVKLYEMSELSVN